VKLTKSKLKQLVENELNSALLKETNAPMGQTLQNKVVALERRVAKLEQMLASGGAGNFDHDTGWQHKSEKWNKEGPLGANSDIMKKVNQMSKNFGGGATTQQQKNFLKSFGIDMDDFQLSESNDD
jgi:hypothetical protein